MIKKMYKKDDLKKQGHVKKATYKKHKKSDFSVKNHRLFKVTETNGLNILIKNLSLRKIIIS